MNPQSNASNEKKLQELMSKEVKVIFKESKGQYTFSIPQWGVVAKSDSLSKSYEDFKKKKEHYLKEMIEIGEAEEIPFQFYDNRSVPAASVTPSKYFFFRDGLVGLFVIFILLAVVSGGQVISENINRNISRRANADATQQQEYVEKFENQLEILKPYAKTFKEFWSEL